MASEAAIKAAERMVTMAEVGTTGRYSVVARAGGGIFTVSGLFDVYEACEALRRLRACVGEELDAFHVERLASAEGK